MCPALLGGCLIVEPALVIVYRLFKIGIWNITNSIKHIVVTKYFRNVNKKD